MTTDTKSQILQTALKMFLRSSYKEVSLRDIVNEVGLTKGAFYHYYTSKEQVFEEAVKYFYNHVMIA
ncbi:HTH-type transcriptional repressor KstR2, partial [termite gut metagenome]